MKELSMPTADLKCLTFTREMGLAQKHGTVPGSEHDDLPNIPGRGPKHMYEYIQLIVPDYFVEECNLCMDVRRWDLDTIEDYKREESL